MLAASASNFKSWMRKAAEQLIFVLIYLKHIWHRISAKPNSNALVLDS